MATGNASIILSVLDEVESIPLRKFTVGSGTKITIGRASSTRSNKERPGPQADNAFFDSPVVSRLHAELSFNHITRTMVIEDIDSMHGTTLNGQKLRPRQQKPLCNGDTITIGSNVMAGDKSYPGRTFLFEYRIAIQKPKQSTAVNLNTPRRLEIYGSSSTQAVEPAVFVVPDSSEESNADSDSDDGHESEADDPQFIKEIPKTAKSATVISSAVIEAGNVPSTLHDANATNATSQASSLEQYVFGDNHREGEEVDDDDDDHDHDHDDEESVPNDSGEELQEYIDLVQFADEQLSAQESQRPIPSSVQQESVTSTDGSAGDVPSILPKIVATELKATSDPATHSEPIFTGEVDHFKSPNFANKEEAICQISPTPLCSPPNGQSPPFSSVQNQAYAPIYEHQGHVSYATGHPAKDSVPFDKSEKIESKKTSEKDGHSKEQTSRGSFEGSFPACAPIQPPWTSSYVQYPKFASDIPYVSQMTPQYHPYYPVHGMSQDPYVPYQAPYEPTARVSYLSRSWPIVPQTNDSRQAYNQSNSFDSITKTQPESGINPSALNITANDGNAPTCTKEDVTTEGPKIQGKDLTSSLYKVSIPNIVDPAPAHTVPRTTGTKRKSTEIEDEIVQAKGLSTTEPSSLPKNSTDAPIGQDKADSSKSNLEVSDLIVRQGHDTVTDTSTVHTLLLHSRSGTQEAAKVVFKDAAVDAPVEPLRKKARTSKSYNSSVGSFILGALVGGIGVISALVSLPESYF